MSCEFEETPGIRERLDERLNKITTDEILDRNQLARALGITLQTLSAWTKRGRGPAYAKYGARYRYHRDDVLDYLVETYHDVDSII